MRNSNAPSRPLARPAVTLMPSRPLLLASPRPARIPHSPILLLVLVLTVLSMAAPAWAQSLGSPGNREAIELYAYTFRHQQAAGALAVVQPLLSAEGTVELRPQDNVLAVRDRASSVRQIIQALRNYDQPPRLLAIEVLIVEARRAAFSPLINEQELPPALLNRLKEILPYSNYRVIASTELHTREGEVVTFELGEGFSVRFRPDTVTQGRQLRLQDFLLARRRPGQASKRLLSSTLSLRLDSYMALTLASTESSGTALMVVLNPRVERWGTGRN